MSDSVRPHRWQPTRRPHPWDSPGKNTGVGCHFLFQCMKVKSESKVAQSCPTLATPWTAAHWLLRPRDFPGKSTGVGCHCLLHSCSVMSNSLQPHELQHARPPCPSPTPGIYSNSCPLSWWCHPTISSSFIPFSSRLQSFLASGSYSVLCIRWPRYWSFSFSVSPSKEFWRLSMCLCLCFYHVGEMKSLLPSFLPPSPHSLPSYFLLPYLLKKKKKHQFLLSK